MPSRFLIFFLKSASSNSFSWLSTIGNKPRYAPCCSIVFKNHESFSIDPIKVTKVVDTTGAGDLFASGFLYGLVNDKPIKECGDIGSKSAAAIIKHFGARPKTSLKTIL